MPLSSKDFLDFAVARVNHEFSDLFERWKLIDTKAHSTATIDGIFIAAVFVFIRNTSFKPDGLELFFLAVITVSLLTSMAAVVYSMVMRASDTPPSGMLVLSSVIALLEKKDGLSESEVEERYSGLVGETLQDWVEKNNRLKQAIEKKARLLRIGHYALLFAIVMVFVLLAMELIPTIWTGVVDE